MILIDHANYFSMFLKSYLNAERRGCGCIAIDNFPIFVNKELSKIPLNAITKESTFARLEVLVHWSSIGAVDINLKFELQLYVI